MFVNFEGLLHHVGDVPPQLKVSCLDSDARAEMAHVLDWECCYQVRRSGGEAVKRDIVGGLPRASAYLP